MMAPAGRTANRHADALTRICNNRCESDLRILDFNQGRGVARGLRLFAIVLLHATTRTNLIVYMLLNARLQVLMGNIFQAFARMKILAVPGGFTAAQA